MRSRLDVPRKVSGWGRVEAVWRAMARMNDRSFRGNSSIFSPYINYMLLRLFAVLRTLIVGTLFVSLWTWFAPRWMAMAKHVRLMPEIGWELVRMLIGGAIMVRCCWDV